MKKALTIAASSLALVSTCVPALAGDASDCYVIAAGVENAGDYRLKGFSKSEYNDLLAEQLWAGKLEKHAFLLWRKGSDIAYLPANAREKPKAIAARTFASCAAE